MRRRVLLLAVATALLISACGTSSGEQVTVSAASVLTDAFTSIEQAYEGEHPGVDVVVNFAGSSTLASQIRAGAPIDVVALASEQAMQPLIDDGYVRGVATFASTSMAIVVPTGNPGAVTGLRSLERADVTWAICDAPVPCGVAARAVLAAADVQASPVSLEPDVRAVLAKVMTDEVDAGIVYRTDVLAARGRVDVIDIAPDINVTTRSTIAATTDAGPGSSEFIDFVRSDAGQSILRTYGFEIAS